MKFDLNALHAHTRMSYVYNMGQLMCGLDHENETETVDAVTELNEEYGAMLSALEGAQEREENTGGGFVAFVENFGMDVSTADELESTCDAFDSAYIGEMSVEEYAQQTTEECYDIPEHLANYVDYEAMGRDMTLGGDVSENDGHLFHSNW
jgi:hypothetical protein